jgi:hypothetical protein
LPEERFEDFLKLCLRARRQPSLLSEVSERSQTDSFSWSEVIRHSDTEGVSSLIYDTLWDANIAPPTALNTLHSRYLSTASRNIVIFHELEILLRQPKLKDVRIIVLKGAALSKLVYDGIALRPMMDLDLYSEPGSVLAIQDSLAALGYTALPEPIAESELALRNELRLLKSTSGGVWLDLHWDLFNSPYLQNTLAADWLWNTARSLDFGEGRALVLGPEAQILHLCGHMWLHHHVHRKLLWLHDLAEVIHSYASEVDWKLLITKAQSYRVVIPLQKTLPIIARDWGAPIPPGVLEECKALRVSADESKAFAWHTSRNRPSDELVWVNIARQSNISRRLYYLWTRLFPTPAFMHYRYRIPHPLLLPLYYSYRLGVGLSIGLKILWRRFEAWKSQE